MRERGSKLAQQAARAASAAAQAEAAEAKAGGQQGSSQGARRATGKVGLPQGAGQGRARRAGGSRAPPALPNSSKGKVFWAGKQGQAGGDKRDPLSGARARAEARDASVVKPDSEPQGPGMCSEPES